MDALFSNDIEVPELWLANEALDAHGILRSTAMVAVNLV
jgi:hypothetical protein